MDGQQYHWTCKQIFLFFSWFSKITQTSQCALLWILHEYYVSVNTTWWWILHCRPYEDLFLHNITLRHDERKTEKRFQGYLSDWPPISTLAPTIRYLHRFHRWHSDIQGQRFRCFVTVTPTLRLSSRVRRITIRDSCVYSTSAMLAWSQVMTWKKLHDNNSISADYTGSHTSHCHSSPAISMTITSWLSHSVSLSSLVLVLKAWRHKSCTCALLCHVLPDFTTSTVCSSFIVSALLNLLTDHQALILCRINSLPV